MSTEILWKFYFFSFVVLIKNVFVPVIKEVDYGVSCLSVLSVNHCMLNAKIYRYKDVVFYIKKRVKPFGV